MYMPVYREKAKADRRFMRLRVMNGGFFPVMDWADLLDPVDQYERAMYVIQRKESG